MLAVAKILETVFECDPYPGVRRRVWIPSPLSKFCRSPHQFPFPYPSFHINPYLSRLRNPNFKSNPLPSCTRIYFFSKNPFPCLPVPALTFFETTSIHNAHAYFFLLTRSSVPERLKWQKFTQILPFFAKERKNGRQKSITLLRSSNSFFSCLFC